MFDFAQVCPRPAFPALPPPRRLKPRPAVFLSASQRFQADTCVAPAQAAADGQLELVALARGPYPGRRLPPKILPGLRTIGFWNAPHRQDWGLPWHRNEGLEITCLDSGSVAFAVENLSVTLLPGSLTVTRPWQAHRVGNPEVGAGKLFWLILDLGVRRPNQSWQWPAWVTLTLPDKKRLTTLLRHNENPVWTANREMRALWHRLGRSVAAPADPLLASRLTAQINDLLVLLLDLLTHAQAPLDASLSGGLRTVGLFLDELRHDARMAAHPWTLPSMAGHCGLGTTAFVTFCRQLTNRAPIRFLTDCRLAWACRRLETTGDSITAIALDCGFNSSQYFATVFRRHLGQTPQSWRSSRHPPRPCGPTVPPILSA